MQGEQARSCEYGITEPFFMLIRRLTNVILTLLSMLANFWLSLLLPMQNSSIVSKMSSLLRPYSSIMEITSSILGPSWCFINFMIFALKAGM